MSRSPVRLYVWPRAMSNLNISLTEQGAAAQISEIRLDGVIDTITAAELEEVIDSLLKRQRHRIIIDLAGVDYISSAGWGIFISHIKDVRSHEGDIKLANMVPDVLEVFELLEFNNVLKAFPSVQSAADDFPPAPISDEEKKRPR